jgi:hypothetical protein
MRRRGAHCGHPLLRFGRAISVSANDSVENPPHVQLLPVEPEPGRYLQRFARARVAIPLMRCAPPRLYTRFIGEWTAATEGGIGKNQFTGTDGNRTHKTKWGMRSRQINSGIFQFRDACIDY